MPDFTTAFEISRGSNGVWSELMFRLAIGLGAFVVGIFGVARAWRRRSSWRDWIFPLFTLAWSCGWIVLHDFGRGFGHVNGLLDAYRQQRYDVAEGDVKVLHRQPSTGHSKGDIVRIGDAQLEVNYFYATPAYRNTIAHGGVLDEGVHARVYHRDGEILRVDVRK